MKLIIAGSRSFCDYQMLKKIVSVNKGITEIVSGTARGADSLGEKYGEEKKLKVTKFPANWDKYGKKAGYIRNIEMALYADEAIVFWDGKSKGSKNMIEICKEYAVPCFVVHVTI